MHALAYAVRAAACAQTDISEIFGTKNGRSIFHGSGYVPEKEYPTVSINAILVTILLRCSFYNLIVKKRPRVSLYSTECREKSPNQIDQLKRGYIDVPSF